MRQKVNYRSYKYYDDYRSSLRNFLNEWHWEWFCSLNLTGNDVAVAEKHLKAWRIQVCLLEHVQVWYVGCLSYIPHPHIHLLMAGRDRYGHSLQDIGKAQSESAWAALTHSKAVIEDIYDKGAVNYIAFCNTPPERFELVIPYNRKMLQKKLDIKTEPKVEHTDWVCSR